MDLKMKNRGLYSGCLLANDILGGGYQGRINLNLREDKGYTYGAGSSLGVMTSTVAQLFERLC